jgi:hypothetical protein
MNKAAAYQVVCHPMKANEKTKKQESLILQSGKKLTSLIHFKCISKYIKKN